MSPRSKNWLDLLTLLLAPQSNMTRPGGPCSRLVVLRTAAKGRLGLQSGIVYYKSTRYGVRQVVAQGAKGKRQNKQKYMNRIVCLAKLSLR